MPWRRGWRNMADPQKRYPPELRKRAARMVLEDPNDDRAITRIAG